MTHFVQPEKIEIDANERAVNEKSPYCFFVCTTFDSFLNDMSIKGNHVFSVATDLNKKIVTYTDSKGEEQTTTFYLYGSPDADASQNEEQVHTTPEGGGNS